MRLFHALAVTAFAASLYFPPPGAWDTVAPEAAGFDPAKLIEAVDYARSTAVTEPSDLHQVITDAFAPREPNFRILGPTKPRAGDSGIILKNGRIVAEWGDTRRADMTFSVAKSYLATVAAVALRDGEIRDVHHRVAKYLDTGHFDGNHNGAITWHHLLQQTSDWSGTLWDVPDWADRPEGDDPQNRPLHEPGTRFKYNDVRINLLAYALMLVLEEPLPDVLKREIMDPIGASDGWRWHGYENSWVELNGKRMQSVSGGGHFGGGMFISTRDHARFGLLMLNRGIWHDRRLLPDEWFDQLRVPTKAKTDYGYLWWLNTNRKAVPAAPVSAYWAAGFGGNYIYIDEENDLVIVMRWTPDLAGVVREVYEALASQPAG